MRNISELANSAYITVFQSGDSSSQSKGDLKAGLAETTTKTLVPA